MRGPATQAVPGRIVEERQQSRYAPFAAAAHRAASRSSRWLRCSLLTYRHRVCSSLAPRQRALRPAAWGPAASCTGNFFTDPMNSPLRGLCILILSVAALPPGFGASKSPVRGEQGMVVSTEVRATQAGVESLTN